MKPVKVITYNISPISRGKGRSVVQMAAYCARDKLYNRYNGLTYSTPKSGDLVFNKIMLPNHAPRDFLDRKTLWNAVELVEKNVNARLARSLYYTLPRGLGIETYIKMAVDYVQEHFVDRGMCADVFIHDNGEEKPHVHTLLTTRSLGENGEWLYKQHRNYLLNSDGTRIRNPITNKYMLGKSIKINDWDDRENIELWRFGWANICNRELDIRDLERVTHISYARQGLDIEPTKHMGRRVIELKNRDIQTDRGNENRETVTRNEEHEMTQEITREQRMGRGRNFKRMR